jgi:hypothetical protein
MQDYPRTPSRGDNNGDDVWKETDSLNADDMLPMAEPPWQSKEPRQRRQCY